MSPIFERLDRKSNSFCFPAVYAADVGGVCPTGSKKYRETCCCHNGCCWSGCPNKPQSVLQSCIKNVPFPVEWIWDDVKKKNMLHRKGKSIVLGVHRSGIILLIWWQISQIINQLGLWHFRILQLFQPQQLLLLLPPLLLLLLLLLLLVYVSMK